MIERDYLSQSNLQQVGVVGIGRRSVAYVIDSLLLSVVGACAGFGVGSVIGVSIGNTNDATNLATLTGYCLGIVLNTFYYVAFWAATGQTIGKMVMGIKVVSTDGTPITWAQGIVRYIGYIIGSIVLLLGFAWIAFDDKRQGWHDKMAKTVVVRSDTAFSSDKPVQFFPKETLNSSLLLFLYAGVFCVFPIIIIAVLTVLGPQIGDVFTSVTPGTR